MQKLSLLLIPLFALVMLAGCGADDSIPEGADQPATDMASDHKTLSGKHTVVMKTSKGDITLELDADAAPKTVSNFVVHAQNGYYDDLIFHRVIPDFMIQGGDPDGNGTGGVSIYGDTFEDEINAKTYKLHKKKLSEEVGSQPLPDEMKDLTVMEYNEMMGYVYNDDLKSLSMERGVIAMANRGPNTNGSQFFLITREGGTPWLEGKHTVFGKITDGMDVIDAIQIVSRDGSDKPFDDVTFSVEVQ